MSFCIGEILDRRLGRGHGGQWIDIRGGPSPGAMDRWMLVSSVVGPECRCSRSVISAFDIASQSMRVANAVLSWGLMRIKGGQVECHGC